MKKITIEIETINDAFGIDEEGNRKELSRFFSRLSMDMCAPKKPLPTKILDTNGNTVGRIRVKD